MRRIKQPGTEINSRANYRADKELTGARWRKLRSDFIKLHGAFCQGAEHQGDRRIDRPHSAVLDHVRERRDFPAGTFDSSNFQLLCRSCHRIKTGAEAKKRFMREYWKNYHESENVSARGDGKAKEQSITKVIVDGGEYILNKTFGSTTSPECIQRNKRENASENTILPKRNSKASEMPKKKNLPMPPKHLTQEAQRLWRDLARTNGIEDRVRLILLTVAAECYDELRRAKSQLRADGPTIKTRFGEIKPHPAVTAERSARRGMLEALAALNIDLKARDHVPVAERRANVAKERSNAKSLELVRSFIGGNR